ncbi:MAG: histidine phosphatase family protein [Chloroflexi bacterium]|nr:histidine phosphatase family protein [Chloroflexota bacterium]
MYPPIWFETHSVSTDNEAGIATGWLPGELSAAGREAATEIGQRHAEHELAAVFCSDLRRAVQTAELAFSGRGVSIFHDWRLRECSYGALNGAPKTAVDSNRVAHVDMPWPSGESYADVVNRVGSFVGDLSCRWFADPVLVIGHSATKWALDTIYENRPLEAAVAAGMTWQPGWRYGFERARPRGGVLHFGGKLADHIDEEHTKDFGG